ncbi:MAG: PQQ-binding-like beta-propeller repeat protein [Chloroflexi bacterium]|nr:PQQ-binding-like beta-propeller repeat protein [Chloroflexota bacterium]
MRTYPERLDQMKTLPHTLDQTRDFIQPRWAGNRWRAALDPGTPAMGFGLPACALALVVLGLAPAAAAVENWPQFRGTNGRGLSAVTAPATWNIETRDNVRWIKDVPGLGHASPILWQDHIYVATAVRLGAKADLKIGVYGDGDSYQEKEPHQWRLLCFDKATGKLLWNKLGHEAVPRQERHTKATHCNSTPATDGRRIVAIFGSEGLFCFDMDGSLLWKKDLGKMDAGPWNAPRLQWSFAGSPLLHDGKVIVQCDVLSEQFLAVFDAGHGREIWRTARREAANWCTPAMAETKGRAQIVLNGWKQLGGYDFETGQQIWTLSGGGDIPVPAPLIVEDWAFFNSAHGQYRPLRAVRLSAASGDITPPELASTNAAIAWCHPRLGSYMQTPLVVGNNLWSCDWLGILSCVDKATGKIHYSERLGKGGQAFTASGIAAGNCLYFTSEAGDVFVVEAASRCAVLATNRLGGLCLATPAASDGTVYFRTTDQLIAIASQ